MFLTSENVSGALNSSVSEAFLAKSKLCVTEGSWLMFLKLVSQTLSIVLKAKGFSEDNPYWLRDLT